MSSLVKPPAPNITGAQPRGINFQDLVPAEYKLRFREQDQIEEAGADLTGETSMEIDYKVS